MPDLVAQHPALEVVSRPDRQELDLWARVPFYPGPELVAYRIGPIAFVASSGGIAPVKVALTPSLLAWSTVAPTVDINMPMTPSEVTWATIAPTVQIGSGAALFFTWSDNEES